jgi:glutathione peroxidase
MAGLQVLEETFSAQGFRVLGFYSDDFGSQGGSDDQIDMCTGQYMVTFEQFTKGHVIDPDGSGPETTQPVWTWLLAQPNPDPMTPLAPDWNFHKYLVSRDGQLVAHFVRSVYPGDDPDVATDSFDTNPIVVAIQAELAQPP